MKDNLETYLYIFFAVIYVISRIIKARSKKKQAQKPATSQQQQARPQHTSETPPPPPQKKAFSFDDILKQFEKNLAGEESQEEKVVEEIKEEKPVPIALPAVAALEEKPNPFQDYKNTTVKSAQEIKRVDLVFKRNENLAIKAKVVHPYVKMMRNPDGFKNAVVLSEIINTKYF